MMTTNRIRNVDVAHHARENGKSGYRFSRLVSDALDNILSNSALPLQLVSYLGFACAGLSFALTAYFLCKYLFGGIGVPGWTTIVLLLLFFFGVVLFSLGVVGEYLIRILRQVQQSPGSIIRKKEL
jgi:dolichol-phosphate mannosyltransferase/undecaprenyl-phosphate 4-deoxy-4-formamido-L-arabinose transferase